MANDSYEMFPTPLSPEAFASKLGQFTESLVLLGQNPPGNSEELTAFSDAALELIHAPDQLPQFTKLVHDFVNDRQLDAAPYMVQLFWRAFQYKIINHRGYPRSHRQPEAWDTSFRSLLTKRADFDEIQEVLAQNNIQSNIPERYAGLKMTVRIYQRLGLLPVELSLLDVGCSAALGQVQLEQNIPFTSPYFKGAAKPIRHLVREFLSDPLQLTTNIGIDSVQMSSDQVRWIEANSYYPKELLYSEKRRSRKQLYNHARAFGPVWADITEDDERLETIRSFTPDGRYNVVSALTMLYELRSGERAVALDTIDSLTSDLVFVQDFAEVSKVDPSKLDFHHDIYDTSSSRYNMFVRHKATDDERWVRLGQWDGGRCRKFIPSEQFIRLVNKLVVSTTVIDLAERLPKQNIVP